MENATKGLMIAGAILIAIVLIGIGVFLVSRAQGFMDQGGKQFDEMTVQAFNSPFEAYENKQSGSNVRALLTKVNSNNLTAASEETYAEKGIDVYIQTGSTEPSKPDIEGSKSGYASSTVNTAKNLINTGKTYYVAFGYDNTSGLIRKIGIATTSADAIGLVKESTTNNKGK